MVKSPNLFKLIECQDFQSLNFTQREPILVPQPFRHKEDLLGPFLGKGTKRLTIPDGRKEPSTEEGGRSFDRCR